MAHNWEGTQNLELLPGASNPTVGMPNLRHLRYELPKYLILKTNEACIIWEMQLKKNFKPISKKLTNNALCLSLTLSSEERLEGGKRRSLGKVFSLLRCLLFLDSLQAYVFFWTLKLLRYTYVFEFLHYTEKRPGGWTLLFSSSLG